MAWAAVIAPLQAHCFGHGECERNAFGCRHEGQGNAGVAAGWFNQLFAAPSKPSCSAWATMATPMRHFTE
jgi:hypothetical protein